ncbi:MAG: T9SS type A sorting domain-containing protein [Ignavibacteriaceae bacterium]|nr:T9SS type A sorting domain-containing protein [Ignavibacteriaceae bacterium]
MLPKFIIITLFFTVSLFSQTFRFTTDEVYKTGSKGDEIVFEFHITNISQSPQSIYILRTINITPEDWQSSLCFDEACFAPFVDSIVTNEDFGSSPIQPGETRDFSIHVFTINNDGVARVSVTAYNMNNPEESYTHSLIAKTPVLTESTFSFVPDSYSVAGQGGEELVVNFNLVNNSTEPQSFYIVRTLNLHPDLWQVSLCFDESCFAPFVDSVVTNEDFGSSTLQPGEHRDFSIHFFTDNTIDSARAQILAVSVQNPLDIKVVNLFATTDISGDIKEFNPSNFTLFQNYPNPFNPETNIKFSISEGSDVSLKVFDLQGKIVQDIVTGYFNAGEYEFKFDASNFASGIYYYEFKSNNFKQSKKMVILK